MLPTDEDLLRQISQAQTGALSELYDRYGRLVFSLALRIVDNPAAAEEITQDVFVQVWHNAATYQPALSKVTTWLTSITRYRSIDILRRSKVRPDGHMVEDALEDLSLTGSRDDLPENQIENRGEQLRMKQALADLPEEQRIVLQMAYFQGLSQPEMAAALNQPLGTVKTRVRLGLQKLRSALDADEKHAF